MDGHLDDGYMEGPREHWPGIPHLVNQKEVRSRCRSRYLRGQGQRPYCHQSGAGLTKTARELNRLILATERCQRFYYTPENSGGCQITKEVSKRGVVVNTQTLINPCYGHIVQQSSCNILLGDNNSAGRACKYVKGKNKPIG